MSSEMQSLLGVAVRTRRKQLGISQEELAARAGLHRTYVADVERGARNLSLASIGKLAQALDVSIPALFSRAEGAVDGLLDGVVDIVLVEGDSEAVKRTVDAFEANHLTNRVHVVRDGAEALEYVFCRGRYARRGLQNRPQIVLLDLKLPKLNGLEVLRQIKADQRTRAIPVLVLADSRRQPGLAESLRLGAGSFLVKPLAFNRFAGMVAQLELRWALLRHAPAAPVLSLPLPLSGSDPAPGRENPAGHFSGAPTRQ